MTDRHIDPPEGKPPIHLVNVEGRRVLDDLLRIVLIYLPAVLARSSTTSGHAQGERAVRANGPHRLSRKVSSKLSP